MSFNFDRETSLGGKSRISGEIPEPKAPMENSVENSVLRDWKEKKSERESVKKQNSVLVEALMGDKKFESLFSAVVNEDAMKRNFRKNLYRVFLAFASIYSLYVAGFTSGFFGSLIFVLFFYFVYHLVAQNWIENIYYKFHLKKFKNFFDGKEHFLSFLDSLINNRFIGSVQVNDLGLNLSSPQWMSVLLGVLRDKNAPEELLQLYAQDGNINTEISYLKLKHLLEVYYTSDKDEDLKEFLSEVHPYLLNLMKNEFVNSASANKQELFNVILDKIGK